MNVIDVTGNPGGGMRFVRALVPALQRVRPELRTTFFGTGASLGPDGIADDLIAAGISVAEPEWLPTKPWKSRSLRSRMGFAVRGWTTRRPFSAAHYVYGRFVNEIGRADIAYFPWPYGLSAPTLACPMVSTVHDLNFKYFFGVPNFSASRARELDTQIGDWLTLSKPVVSSKFMLSEVVRHYPAAPPPRVIRLAAFSDPVASSTEAAPLPAGVKEPFVLCPTQTSVHKNNSTLIAAHSVLRKRFPGIQLVLTGAGTDGATGRATAIGIDRDAGSPDVLGLGYVSNTTIDLLIDRAAVVVNASLYEAGNGPGCDAWTRGTPVAMSDIPAFREHVDALGVVAALFDPRDPADIAAKIADVLAHPDHWADSARRSQAAMNARTWDQVAGEYLEVFDATWSRARNE